MKKEGSTESELGDYDDAPGRRSGHPLIRVLRAAGALVTVGLAAMIGGVVALRIDAPPLFYLGCAVVSLASMPLIMLFWSEEFTWRGRWVSSSASIFAVSILTWVAEVLFSAIMLIIFLNLIR
jgi:hypothetical protein